MWPADVFAMLHHVAHISLSLRPVKAEFDLSVDYLQSLMMVVALVLAIGFSLLVMLALFLCLIISFAPPIVWPTWTYRLTVVVCAISVVVVTAKSLNGTADMGRGTHELVDMVENLHNLTTQVCRRTIFLSTGSYSRRPAVCRPASAYNM